MKVSLFFVIYLRLAFNNLSCILQISTLVTHRERPFCSERSVRALARVGQAVNLAIERFVTVGETIADDNPEIKCEMYQACKDARSAGKANAVDLAVRV